MTSDTDERLLRLRDVKQKTGLGSSTIYRRIADGTFPPPRSLGPNTVRWLQSEVDAWIKSLPSSRSGEPASASDFAGWHLVNHDQIRPSLSQLGSPLKVFRAIVGALHDIRRHVS